MINQQPKSFMNNSDTLFAKNQQTFTSNETYFKSEVDSGFEGNFSESEIQTKPDVVPLEVNEIEEKNKIQNDDCCRDCNSINCPHCDCSFW